MSNEVCCHYHQGTSKTRSVPHYELTEKGKKGLDKLDVAKEYLKLQQLIKTQGVTLVYSQGCICGTGDYFTPLLAVDVNIEEQSIEVECGTFACQRGGQKWFVETEETRGWLDKENVHLY